MSDIEKRIGARITEIRLSRRLTQFQVAEKINVSVETVSSLERGVSIPSLRTLEFLAEKLNVSLGTFFDFEEAPVKHPAFEREIAKLISLLRVLSYKELRLLHEVLRIVVGKFRWREQQGRSVVTTGSGKEV